MIPLRIPQTIHNYDLSCASIPSNVLAKLNQKLILCDTVPPATSQFHFVTACMNLIHELTCAWIVFRWSRSGILVIGMHAYLLVSNSSCNMEHGTHPSHPLSSQKKHQIPRQHVNPRHYRVSYPPIRVLRTARIRS